MLWPALAAPILRKMVTIPGFNEAGDLPSGVHQTTLAEVIDRLGHGSVQRQLVAQRLRRIHELAVATGHLARFILFGSFVTTHLTPHDVDVFLIMDDGFNTEELSGEALILFSHALAQAYFGASVFWIRRLAALGGEDAMIEQWQLKRNGTRRGILEVIAGDQ